jgi:hypothetical protein
MPLIAEVQDFISDEWRSSYRYDDLVRAPIPVLVSITVGIRVPQGTPYSVTEIRTAIAKRVNHLGFTNQLSSSVIADVIHQNIDVEGMVIMPIDLLGELIDPATGQGQIFRSGNVLHIPEDYTRSISKRTVMFFVNPENVDIYVEN